MDYYLNALGVINALGRGIGDVRGRLYAGWTGGMTKRDDFIVGRTVRVGAVRGTLPDVEAEYGVYASRNIGILRAAVDQIRPEIDAAIERFGARRVGIVLGTGTSGVEEGLDAYAARLANGTFPAGYDYRRQEISAASEYLRRALGLRGPAFCVSTACTASAKAFSAARRLLRAGFCDAVIVGGVDALCRVTLNGFNALESVAADRCNPFSRNRDGINIGEGAAIFLMTREPGPVRLLGLGESSDAHHISAPDPDGGGAEAAMRGALAEARTEAGAVDYVNLHGTATPQNDRMESHAVARVLGTRVPCSSTKPLIGHLLGAAGASELAFCWMLLSEPHAVPLPPHVYDGRTDPDLAPLNLVRGERERKCAITLSNSFAFGGNNACVVLGRNNDG
jgi:3-oxoacyl-[acyl-carrier-protein] synthase-1